MDQILSELKRTQNRTATVSRVRYFNFILTGTVFLRLSCRQSGEKDLPSKVVERMRKLLGQSGGKDLPSKVVERMRKLLLLLYPAKWWKGSAVAFLWSLSNI